MVQTNDGGSIRWVLGVQANKFALYEETPGEIDQKGSLDGTIPTPLDNHTHKY